MKFYITGRRAGKTSIVLDWFCAAPLERMVVMPDAVQARRFAQEAFKRLKSGNPDMTFDRIYRQVVPASSNHLLRGRRDITVGVDNVDMILSYLFGDVKLVIGTGDE